MVRFKGWCPPPHMRRGPFSLYRETPSRKLTVSRSRFRNTRHSSPPVPQPRPEALRPSPSAARRARCPRRSCSPRPCGIWSGTPTETETRSPRSGRRTPSPSPRSALPTSRSSSRVRATAAPDPPASALFVVWSGLYRYPRITSLDSYF